MHRIFRGGQTEKTETILIEAKGTVEKRVYERLSKKSGHMQRFIDLLKERSAG
jgi:SNF2 family DNA or RNA helicase